MTSTPNILWTFFEKKDNGKAECKECKSLIVCTGGTPSGLIKHLKSKHKENHDEYIKSKEDKEAENVSKRKSRNEHNDGFKQPKLDFG